jgi:hypothetical protein
LQPSEGQTHEGGRQTSTFRALPSEDALLTLRIAQGKRWWEMELAQDF